MLLRRWPGTRRLAVRYLSKEAKPGDNLPKTTTMTTRTTPAAANAGKANPTAAIPELLPTTARDSGGGGGRRRSRLRTFLALTGAPVLVAGSAIAAYHINDDFRQLMDTHLGPDNIEELKRRAHGLVGNGGENGVERDDFERERRPDVPIEDLEESPLPTSASAVQPLPSDVIRSDQFRAYLHVLVQEREDALRDEFNAHLDRHIADRLETQLEARTKELQARCDADLVSKKQDLDAQFEADRERRLSRMAAIEAQVGQVDRIIHTVEDKLSQSEKAHAVTTAAIGLEIALGGVGPIEPRLALLYRFENDEVIGSVLKALPQDDDDAVPSADQIRSRFQSVAKACRQAALVPADAGFVGHLIGRLFAMLLINRDMYVAGDDDLAKLGRGQYYLAQADLGDAVQEIDALDPEGLPSALASDWLAAAKKRLALEYAASFLKLYACQLSQASVADAASA